MRRRNGFSVSDRASDAERHLWDPHKLDFKHRCSRKLEELGDAATNARRHDEAIFRYSAALALDHTTPQTLLVKRSTAYVVKGLSKDALNDANKVCHFCLIEVFLLDGESSDNQARSVVSIRLREEARGLPGAGRYRDAIDAFEMMLSRMMHSSDPEIRGGVDSIMLRLIY
jgi:tetratricopeptide (TPR) repeat protein